MTPSGESDILVRLGPPSGGDVIHRASCRYARGSNALRWRWADDPDHRAELPAIGWLRPCGHCRPYVKCTDPRVMVSR